MPMMPPVPPGGGGMPPGGGAGGGAIAQVLQQLMQNPGAIQGMLGQLMQNPAAVQGMRNFMGGRPPTAGMPQPLPPEMMAPGGPPPGPAGMGGPPQSPQPPDEESPPVDEAEQMASDQIDQAGGTWDGVEAPTKNDIQRLQEDPSPANVKSFDAQFGQGMAEKYLGGEEGEEGEEGPQTDEEAEPEYDE